MPITGQGWEIHTERTHTQRRADRKARTLGRYQVFHDGAAVAALILFNGKPNAIDRHLPDVLSGLHDAGTTRALAICSASHSKLARNLQMNRTSPAASWRHISAGQKPKSGRR